MARQKAIEDFVARRGQFLQGLLALDDSLAVSPGRIGVAVEDSGVKPGSVFARPFGCAGAVGRIVPDRFQAPHADLLRFELLVFLSVCDAR